MHETSLELASDCDIFIACAAVADYRPEHYQQQKIKKEAGEKDTLEIRLIKNPDIVSDVAKLKPRPFILGFAAESQALEDNAQAKLSRKGLDMIAANDISNPEIGFNSDTNALTLFYKQNEDISCEKLEQASKYILAQHMIEKISNLL